MNQNTIGNRIVVIAGPKRGIKRKKLATSLPMYLGSTCRIVLIKNSELVGKVESSVPKTHSATSMSRNGRDASAMSGE
jgi:hypothetical protein